MSVIEPAIAATSCMARTYYRAAQRASIVQIGLPAPMHFGRHKKCAFCGGRASSPHPMRVVVLWAVLLAYAPGVHSEPLTALAPRVYSCAFDLRTPDVRGASAFGLDAGFRVGGGRWQALGELGIGKLVHDGWLGHYARAQVGARFLAATLSTTAHYAADFVLDAGGGGERDWLAGVVDIDRPYVFAGWGMQLRFPSRRSLELVLRVSTSPVLDDPVALRTICRGTCSPSDAPPVDIGIDVSIGVAAW